ncbi:glycosyl transferase [Acetobacter pasteurianus]|uniref:glycosyltransferase n=1 Tax=Acetobacter pasteurianus TaxID=438 RepID=UPI00024575D5|nr:glycosyltransferase [Acetobacter pasteurianus]RCL09371.1 glycosyl transferase [Acetobacter pasteurianus]GAB30761.1 glycosyl transferase [Acetobacter pasteurianus subsp. pasteurianus LMG 1262 = NBRC 106471]GCD50056.1 glycosyl transferase [Acetobacter pasteurianus subsp. pasteurianus LMG 1262 = NBRC 106471]
MATQEILKENVKGAPMVLQNIIFPALQSVIPEELYFRALNEKVELFRAAPETLSFHAGGRAAFDTYFNGITVERWRELCAIENLNLTLEGSGKFIVRFGLHQLALPHRWLFEQTVELKEGTPVSLDLPFWAGLERGLLYMWVEALEDGYLRGGNVSTTQRPVRDARMAIVITHFNRKPHLLPALQKLEAGLNSAPQWKDRVQVIVVDNSQNVTPDEAGSALVIPNRNLGGAGGFTRGLLYAKDHGFTHCLFMDDDASCDFEAVCRAYMLLSYSTEDRAAIVGSQLRETVPWQLHEAGARFVKGRWIARKHMLDMRNVHHLLLAEMDDSAANYGGWWFFAFPISAVRHFPYPFFVRGDDAEFSLQNKFPLVTMNGICSMAEDFSVKESPMTRYLGLRATMVLMMLNGEEKSKPYLDVFLVWFRGVLFSYNYASAKVLILAMKHVMEGPEFFVRNMDMANVRAQIGALTPSEKMVPYDLKDIEVLHHHHHDGRIRRLARLVTLNGTLLPAVLMRDDVRFQFKDFNAAFRDIFRFKHVLYYHEATRTGYVATQNRKLFFELWKEGLALCAKFARAMPALQQAYVKALPNMTTEDFWRHVYKNELTTEKENS